MIKPVYHVAFLPKILKILRCVCFHCSKLLVDPNDPKIVEIIRKTQRQTRQRLDLIAKACDKKKKKICQGYENFHGCGRTQPHYTRDKLQLNIEWKNTDDENVQPKSTLSAERVRAIFQRIDSSTCQILGMNPRHSRPDWMILTVLPVPPMCVRPSVLLFGTARCQDDLTYNLAKIVEANNKLREDEERGTATHIVDEHLAYLQFCCATLVNNDTSKMPQLCQKDGRPLKTLTARLKGLISLID